jgi:hypothetical protein
MTSTNDTVIRRPMARAEGAWSDLALHTIGWKAFQDLCSQVCEEVLRQPVEVFREAQDGGQDAVFLLRTRSGEHRTGTVQCKHSCHPQARLRVGALTSEFEAVKELVKAGEADTYVLMTSMSVDAPVAVTVRQRLRALGVRRPHVLGRQYLIRTIRSSARLRALVPQVYGLGDLTAILDERTRQQTRALLDHWIPKLKAYVPTAAHRRAVRALDKQGIVLLLGNPSSGKSAIGAILSTMAADNPDHTVYSLTSPRDFETSWNPHDPGRFFWIDDAFGSNVVREEFVQDWTSTFKKVQAAIGHGNRFLLTSRRHVYEAARVRLGQRNLPAFLDGGAVVDVGELTPDEKRQILYNHIAFGNQTQAWKTSAKPHLETVSQVENFLPGIAERLGDPAFTKSVSLTADALSRFMREPKTHLIDTINALDEPLRAALILVYVHQGSLTEQTLDKAATEAVSASIGVPLSRIQDALPELRGSFLRLPTAAVKNAWTFAHPTISDALTDILKERPHMIAALLRGATLETVLSTCVCEGGGYVTDALKIPDGLSDVLVARLIKTPDERSVNHALFAFLADKTTDDVFRKTIERDPELLHRDNLWSSKKSTDPLFRVLARAHRLGCLDECVRLRAAERLECAVVDDFDLSCLEDSDLLSLITPIRLVALGMRVRAAILPAVPDRVQDAVDEFDPDYHLEDVFDEFSGGIEVLDDLGDLDDATISLIRVARESIARGGERVREKITAARNKEDHSLSWGDMGTVSAAKRDTTSNRLGARSVFDDVDRLATDTPAGIRVEPD